MAKTEMSFRIAQYREIENLLERMRQAHEQPVQAPAVERPAEPGGKDPAAIGPDGPAHRDDVVAKQHTRNMVAEQYTHPEAFGRRRDGSRVIVKASESPSDFMPPGRQSESVRARGRQYPSAAGVNTHKAETPSWLQQEQCYADAVAAIEEVGRQAYLNPPTRGAAAAAPAQSAAGQVAQKELAAEEQEPTWVRQIEQYAPGRDEVASGHGKEVGDDGWEPDRQVTRTFHGHKGE